MACGPHRYLNGVYGACTAGTYAEGMAMPGGLDSGLSASNLSILCTPLTMPNNRCGRLACGPADQDEEGLGK